MLVLQRKANEFIMAGNVRIDVCWVKGGKVQLGFTAPADVRILRGELLDEPGDKESEQCG